MGRDGTSRCRIHLGRSDRFEVCKMASSKDTANLKFEIASSVDAPDLGYPSILNIGQETTGGFFRRQNRQALWNAKDVIIHH